ncbi:MAG: hypothetical protein FWD32_01190 [Firmicutes bacterium]|nr:hypothetical protein [Bacillota bacterium]
MQKRVVNKKQVSRGTEMFKSSAIVSLNAKRLETNTNIEGYISDNDRDIYDLSNFVNCKAVLK